MAIPGLEISVANRAKILTKSMFSGYDLCVNPYVGCEFGCSYCYVRFMVKDDEKEWGKFLRVREHLEDKLPKELDRGFVSIETGTFKDATGKRTSVKSDLAIGDARLVLGTMTDPYQPSEKKFGITRKALEILVGHQNQFKKVGLFTRSPLVLRDVDLLLKLPKARVHFTVTPFTPGVLRKIEPYSPVTAARFKVIEKLKAAGLRVHVNVSPVMPILSDGFVADFAEELARIGVDEFFVDPMQPYKESFTAFEEAMAGSGDWQAIKDVMGDKERYLEWKEWYKSEWTAAWRVASAKYGREATLPIWSDHEYKVWVDMRSGESMSKRVYGDEVGG